MDPYYFLNNIKINDDDISLHDILDIGYDGSWFLGDGQTTIIYNNIEYDIIEYNNLNKIISFYNSNELKLELKIILKNINDKNKEKQSILESIVELIDNNKEEMSNLAYINIMDKIQKQYNNL
tara:strand:- start:38 stop:406 length:369 start_codon:yes stop_codon:yes gene_type:complete